MTSREREAMQQFVWSRPPGYTRAVVRLISIAITAQVAQIPARVRLTAGAGKREGHKAFFVVYPLMKFSLYFFSFLIFTREDKSLAERTKPYVGARRRPLAGCTF